MVLYSAKHHLIIRWLHLKEIIKNDFLKWAQFLIILLKNDLSSRMTVYHFILQSGKTAKQRFPSTVLRMHPIVFLPMLRKIGTLLIAITST